MRSIRIDLPAEREIERVTLWYEKQQRDLGQSFKAMVERGMDAIQRYPASFAILNPPYRRYNLDRFPYGIVYEFTSTEIHIVALQAFRRDPDHWKDLLQD